MASSRELLPTIRAANVVADTNGPIRIREMSGMLGMYDANADEFCVQVQHGGEDVELLNYEAAGYFTRADGKTIKVSGTVDGPRAYIVLSRDCYLIPGPYRLVVKVSYLMMEQTLVIFTGEVADSMSGDFWKDCTLSIGAQALLGFPVTVEMNVPTGKARLYEKIGQEYQLFRELNLSSTTTVVYIKPAEYGQHTYVAQPVLGESLGNYSNEVTITYEEA